jgi:peptide/nickel transport system substrate-binding protein
VVGTAAAGSMLVYFNLKKIIDPNVRHAASHAIDRESVVKALYQQYGEVAQYNIPKAMSFYYDPTMPGAGFDTERAKTILEEGGWKVGPDGIRANARGEKLTWTMPASSIASQIAGAQMIAGMLTRVGIQANIQIMDFRTYEARAIAGDYDVVY